MSHSSHSCCHATHNADGGLLEGARLIQVLPAEVRERLEGAPHKKKKPTLLPWPSSKIKLSVAFKCLGWRPEAALSQRNWQCRAAFSLCSRGLSASFGRLSRIPPQSTQSHAEKKHTGVHVSLHGPVISLIKKNKWRILHILQQASCRTCVQRTCNATPLTRAPSVSLPWRTEPVQPFKMPTFGADGRMSSESKGWGRVVGLQGVYLGKRRSDRSSRWRPCAQTGRRKKNSWQEVWLKDKRFEHFARRDAKPSFSFLKAVWFFVTDKKQNSLTRRLIMFFRSSCLRWEKISHLYRTKYF